MNNKRIFFLLAAGALAVWYFFFRDTDGEKTSTPTSAPLTPRPGGSNAINGITNPYLNNGRQQRDAANKVLAQGSGSGNGLDVSASLKQLAKSGVDFATGLFRRTPRTDSGSSAPWDDPNINPRDDGASLLPPTYTGPGSPYWNSADDGITYNGFGIPDINGVQADTYSGPGSPYWNSNESSGVVMDEYGIPSFDP